MLVDPRRQIDCLAEERVLVGGSFYSIGQTHVLSLGVPSTDTPRCFLDTLVQHSAHSRPTIKSNAFVVQDGELGRLQVEDIRMYSICQVAFWTPAQICIEKQVARSEKTGAYQYLDFCSALGRVY